MSGKDWAVTVAVGLCAIGLLACGAGGGSSSSGGDEAAFEESRLKMSECLRKHGLDVPDPVPGQKGVLIQESSKKGDQGGGINPGDPATRKAMEACEDEVGFEPPDVSPEQEEELKEGMLAFAQCMRGHGIDMPDPEFGENGKSKITIGGPGRAGQMDQPAFEAAQEACQDKMPEGGIGFQAGP
jgi:hypothetical protein